MGPGGRTGPLAEPGPPSPYTRNRRHPLSQVCERAAARHQIRSAITLMQHGRRSVVEFTLQLVQVALPKSRVIPEDFGEGGQLTAIDLGLSRP